MFTKLKLNDFRCFQNKEILLGKYLTVLSGGNATGKSTILGILGNSSELSKREGQRIDGKLFRAQFSEIFKYSEEFDKSGKNKCEIFLRDKDNNEFTKKFRITWQKIRKQNKKRFRFIPYTENEKGREENCQKFKLPVIYIGLSRLYPIGEVDDSNLVNKEKNFLEEDLRWYIEKHNKILSLDDSINSLVDLSFKAINKRSLCMNTNTYTYKTNSAGQDNIGQILSAVLSFKKLKDKDPNNFKGGILLIDELDAALHPSSQILLLELLIKEAKSTGFQVVLTTHSLSLLKEICYKIAYNTEELLDNNDIELFYFIRWRENFNILRNPEYSIIENELSQKTSLTKSNIFVNVYSEDEENRWFFKKIINFYKKDVFNSLDIKDVSLGCKELIRLIEIDTHFSNSIIIFDGDVKDDEINKNKKMNNYVRLPGSKRPEETIFDYLKDMEPDHPYWANAFKMSGYSPKIFNEKKPTDYEGLPRERFKKWFKDNLELFDRTELFSFFVNDNSPMIESFWNNFLNVYNNFAKRMLIKKISNDTEK